MFFFLSWWSSCICLLFLPATLARPLSHLAAVVEHTTLMKSFTDYIEKTAFCLNMDINIGTDTGDTGDRRMDVVIYRMSLISNPQTEITVWRSGVLCNVLIGPQEDWAIPDLYWGGLYNITTGSVVWMYDPKSLNHLKKVWKHICAQVFSRILPRAEDKHSH